ncbi:MAG: O-phosphoserine--tRNA ligase [Candidatus Altiarchaeota archaeon]|nr:O-phosphoserine--tRNA ligase [Candidatus Altiarchaeota archaeon]
MKLDTREIKEKAKADFQRTWLETAKLIPEKSGRSYSGGRGSAHPIHELVQKVRKVFIELGFHEIENPVFINEEDVYKQYGPEAPVILDRVYYLAGLPRPDIGLSDAKIAEIKRIANVDIEKFKGILREYREGAIEGDNFLEEMKGRLKVKTEEASAILDLFPEFRSIQPVASKLTLRSHMTGAWFPTLQAMKDNELPLKLFSVGLRFRREQKVDSTHLRAHYGGSMVVMGEDMSNGTGMELSKEILGRLGFSEINFKKKEATSNYYAPGTEYEVYSENIEIADVGMYSPIALANYDIPYHVFNLGFGLERMLMVKGRIKDVRELLYPQFHQVVDLTDEELLGQVEVDLKPKTAEGLKLAEAIKESALKHAQEKSPCEFPAFEGRLMGKNVSVKVVEKEANTMLLGPAALNDIFVHEGAIYGLPKDTSKLKFDVSAITGKGLKAGFSFIDAISSYFAAEVEKRVEAGEKSGLVQVKMAKGPADINVRVSEKARRFIESKNKQISIKGPVFTSVEYEVV